MDKDQSNQNQRLFYLPGVEENEKNAIRHLVQINYPGLLDKGFVECKALHNNRHRRAGGFIKNIAKDVVERHNMIH